MRTQQPLLKSHRCPVWLRALLSLVLGAMLLAAGAAHAQGSSDTITYIHTDISGSPLAATDANGTVLWKESYRGYGQRWLYQGSSAGQPQWFHGKEQDAATGWQYFGARYYDPAVGRFMGIDPVDFQDGNLHSFNRYAYGNNNPIRYLDPDGRLPLPAVGAIVFARMVTWLATRQATALAVVETGALIATGTAAPGMAGVEAVAAKTAATATNAAAGAAKGEAAFFRGAKAGEAPSFVPRAGEFKIDPRTGLVKDTHGVSVFDNPMSVSSRGFTPHLVDQSSIPDSLRIIQRGADPRHFEIVPKPGANLTQQQFTNACGSIVCVR